MDALNVRDEMRDGMRDGTAERGDQEALRWRKIEEFLQANTIICNADVRALCGVSAATASRILARLTGGNL